MPLPVDVAEAIVDWLRDGRPACASRLVLTRLRAPHVGLHPASLNGIIHGACPVDGVERPQPLPHARGADRDPLPERRRRRACTRPGDNSASLPAPELATIFAERPLSLGDNAALAIGIGLDGDSGMPNLYRELAQA
jgi:hypothetical protein